MLRLCALIALLVPTLARAQPDVITDDEERTRRAKVLFEQGRAYVNLGDYPAATHEFEQAYVLKPLPLFLYNLAELALAQKQRQRALRLYERYVAEEKDAGERGRIESRIAELRASLARDPTPDPPSLPSAVEPETKAPPPAQAQPQPRAQTIAPTVTTAPTKPHRDRRWIWGVAVGGAVVVAGAIAIGVVFGTSAVNPTPSLGSGQLR